MLKILFLGLCMFAQRNGGGRTVVLPDLSNGAKVTTPCAPVHIESHLAYIEAAAADVKACPTCVNAPGDRKRLMLNGDVITLDGVASTTYSEDETFATLVPSMKKTCPAFELAIPATATALDITAGTLTAVQMEKGERRSTLAVATSGDITFTATHGGVAGTMVLKPGTTDVTIGNQGQKALGGEPALAENHWLAFYTLAKTEVSCSLPIDSDDKEVQTTIACSNSTYP